MKSLFENDVCTKEANEIASEFKKLFTPLLDKYQDYSTIELEHILVSELSVTLAERRLRKNLRRRIEEGK